MKIFTFRKLGLALLLAVGFMVVGSFAEEVDRRLDGTWVVGVGSKVELERRYNNGQFEESIRAPSFIIDSKKGTYTANNGKLVFTITHVHGSFYDKIMNEGLNPENPKRFKFESKWYSVAELIVFLKSEALRLGESESKINEVVKKIVSDMTSGQEFSYVVDDKTLIVTGKDIVTGKEVVEIYKKK